MQIGCAGSNGFDNSDPANRPIASSRRKSNASTWRQRPLPVLLDPDLARPLHHQFGRGRIVEHIPDRGQQVAQCGFAVSHRRTWRSLVAVGEVDRGGQPDRDRLALVLRKGRGDVDLRLQDLLGQIVGAAGRDVGVAALRHRRLHDAETALGQAQDHRAAKALEVVIVDGAGETAMPEIVRHRVAGERDPDAVGGVGVGRNRHAAGCRRSCPSTRSGR